MRKVYIVSRRKEITQDIIDTAISLGCPEIANGIPPALLNIVTENMLPYVYEEPVQLKRPPMSSHISVLVTVNTTDKRPARVRRTWNGEDYYYDCLITQSVRNEYAQGNIQIGDYVIVHFDDNGEQIVTAKIFKSW